MILAEFENLLKQNMGLDAASIGSSAIERAVQERQAACKLKDARAYWDHIQASANELQELIEAVIVSETWFFRDREAYAVLVRLAFEEWLRTHAEGVLRLLSLPCSTGEEPYSMAMALLDAGFPAERFRVDAVDISARALAQARRALYGRNSFRGAELGFRERHFQPGVHGHHLADGVRRQVHFQQGNLFAEGFLPGVEIYDVIFCRNVLIYFDRATQDRAIKLLQRLLTTQGLLFVGPSETGPLLSHDFVSAKLPLAFAFRKAGAAAGEAEPAGVHRPARAARRIAPPPQAPRRVHHARHAVAVPASAPQEAAKTTLEEIQSLADQGRLAQAAQRCQEYLREHAQSVQALYLMGLVRDAGGDQAQAAGYYRKALYLDPQHYETMIHLAYVLEKQGDTAGGQVLRKRALRLQHNSRP